MATPPPSTVLLHSHDGGRIAIVVPCIVVGFVSMILRLYIKVTTKTGVTLDDWFVIIAFVFFCGYWGVLIDGLITGITGVPLNDIPIPILIRTLKGDLATAPLSVLIITFARYSILWLYWRLFPIKQIHVSTAVVGIAATAWGIACFLVGLLKCTPISASWDILGPPGKCINFTVFFLAEKPFTMILDLLIVIIPIHVVKNLHMPQAKKLQLYFVFTVGLFTSLISVVRLALAAENHNEIVSTSSADWLFLQLTLTIVAVNLPTYGPLLSRSIFTTRIQSLYTSLLKSWSKSSTSRRQGDFERLSNGYQRAGSLERINTAGATSQPCSARDKNQDHALNTITVERTVDMF